MYGFSASPLSNCNQQNVFQKGSDFCALKRDFLLALQFCLCYFLTFKRWKINFLKKSFLKYGLLWSVVSDGLAREQGKALEIDASTQIIWRKTSLENVTISGLSWRILPLKEIFLVWECFDLYSSSNSQHKTAYYSKQMFIITYWGKHTFSVLLVISVLSEII